MSRLLLFVLPLLFCLSYCGNGDAGSAPAAPPPLDSDSLQKAYARRLQQWDSLPTRQVVEKGKLYPVDEGPLDTTFFLYRADLLNAVRQRDVFGVLDHISADIKAGFGGEDKVAAFVETWQLDTSPDSSDLWTTLERLLTLGGAFEENGRRFVAPYVFATWPDEYDAFTYAAITGTGVRVRSAPNLQSRILTTLSYDIVEQAPVTENPAVSTIAGQTHPWVKIISPGGEEAYVFGQYLRSPLDFRAGFEKDKYGRWQMVFLVAGD